MTDIKSWAIILCVTMILSAVTMFIVPEGKTKKIYSYIVSLFILFVVLIPLSGMDFSFITDFNDKNEYKYFSDEEYSVLLNEYIFDSGEATIKTSVEDCLKEICSDEYEINVHLKNSDDNAITIESIEIYINKTDMSHVSIIKHRIANLTGIVPEVKIND